MTDAAERFADGAAYIDDCYMPIAEAKIPITDWGVVRSDVRSSDLAFLIRRSNAVIIGDAIIGKPPGQLSLLPAEKFSDAEKAREGIRIILKYSFDAVLVGDGDPIPRGGRKAVEEFLTRAGSTGIS